MANSSKPKTTVTEMPTRNRKDPVMGAGHDHHTGSNRARLGTALAITATVLVAEVVGA